MSDNNSAFSSAKEDLRTLGYWLHEWESMVDKDPREPMIRILRRTVSEIKERKYRKGSWRDRLMDLVATVQSIEEVGGTQPVGANGPASKPPKMARAARYNKSPSRAVRLRRAARSAMRKGYF